MGMIPTILTLSTLSGFDLFVCLRSSEGICAFRVRCLHEEMALGYGHITYSVLCPKLYLLEQQQVTADFERLYS